MADNNVIKKLRDLMSQNVVIKRVAKNKVKVADLRKYQSVGSLRGTRSYDRYSKLHTSGKTFSTRTMDYQSSNYSAVMQRLQLYTDYESMDSDPIISSALDIYADESTLKADTGEILRIVSDDQMINDVLHNLFYDVLNVEFNLWNWVRAACKYGDYFIILNIKEDVGITNVMPRSAYEIKRVEETTDGINFDVKFVDEGQGGIGEYEEYEVAHFRMLTDTNFLPYGKSMIEAARRIWKQLVMMEDAMLIHRVMRAPERRVFKIDVGNLKPSEIELYINKVIEKTKKQPYVDQATGEYNLKFNMMNMLEDYYLPVRGGQGGTDIDTLQGMEFGGIDDIEYLRNKMMAALKIPKAFLGYDENIEGKATLAAEDVRFARTVERIQKLILSELYKLAIIHLTVQGFEGEQLLNFELELTNPSLIYEQEMIQLAGEKIRIATEMIESKLFSMDHIYEDIYDMTKPELEKEKERVIEDAKQRFRIEQIESEGNDPQESGTTFGTRHDIALMTLRKNKDGEEIEDLDSGWPKDAVKQGRPTEGPVIKYGSDEDQYGRDAIGQKSRDDYFRKTTSPIKHNYKNNSPLHAGLERKYLSKSKILNESAEKRIDEVFKGTFMDSENLEFET